MDDDNEPHDFEERDRGILSKADREFLRGERDLSSQSERDARYRIRNRIRNSIYDFELLKDFLDDDDRQQVFQRISMRNLIAVNEFLYEGLNDTTEDLEDTKELFETLVERAVHAALLKLDADHIINDIHVEIDVDKTTPELDKLRARFKTGEESNAELRYLLYHGSLPQGTESDELTSRLLETGEVEEEDGEISIKFDNYADITAFFEAVREQTLQEDSE